MQNKIWRITLDTNPEDCNLNCIMCEEHSQYSRFKQDLLEQTGTSRRVMSEAMIIKVITEAAAIGVREIIPTTMGDPLISKNFEIIAALVKKHGLKLNVTHNGTFPRKTAAEWAEIIVPITSDIKISWNGATAQTTEAIMKGLNYNESLKKIKEFIAYRDRYYLEMGYYCRISFQMTFMRCNMHETEQVIRLAAELGVDRIKGHHLWVHNCEMQEYSFLQNDETIEEWNEIVSLAKETAKTISNQGKHILLENFEPIDKTEIHEIPESYECPFLGKELWISATGKISPCCAPDNLRQELGDFGNIKSISLSQTIKTNLYQTLVLTYKTKKLCNTCSMRKPATN